MLVRYRLLVVVFAAGAVAAGGCVAAVLQRPSSWDSGKPPVVSPSSAQRPRQDPRVSSTPHVVPSVPPLPRSALDAGDSLRAAGKLKEAQDRYLEYLLSVDPGDPRAMFGLIEVQRRLASNDAARLRRRADAYKAAAERGVGTGEDYTPRAMWLLARASFLAAAQLEFDGSRPGLPAARVRVAEPEPREPKAQREPQQRGLAAQGSRPSVPAVRETPRPRATQGGPRAAAGSATPSESRARSAPSVTPAPQAVSGQNAQLAPPTPRPGGPLYIVRIGSFASREQAEELTARLTLNGYAVQIAIRTSEEPRRYVVLSESASPRAAQARADTLAAAGLRATIRDRGDGRVQLRFGAYPSSAEAEAVVQRVRSKGYGALVIPEGGTVYFIQIGPHSKTMIDGLATIMARSINIVAVTQVP